MFARGPAAEAASESAFLQALLDVEGGLARACASEGLIPMPAAGEISAACRAENFDIAALARQAAEHAQPVVPLVTALRRMVSDTAAEHVHHGATSQDVVDTAMMLVARKVIAAQRLDLRTTADCCAVLAEQHARTPMIGRTLLQQGLPTTFGLKAVGWMVGLDEAAAGLLRVQQSVLAVQLGGPVGTLANAALVVALADELGLIAPTLSWHGNRRRPAETASAVGVAAGATAKLAGDVALLAQNEVGEAREGGLGGRSSSMAHKRNPVASVSILACAQRVPGLVATVFGAMSPEHERAAGGWQAEWPTLLELLRLTGSAAAWSAELAARLEIDPARMEANLARSSAVSGAVDAAAQLVRRALAERPVG
jgi:3-carboxy-cis,cis-muconate cycloisomerase